MSTFVYRSVSRIIQKVTGAFCVTPQGGADVCTRVLVGEPESYRLTCCTELGSV